MLKIGLDVDRRPPAPRQYSQSVADNALAGFFCNGEIGPAGVRLPPPSGEEEPAPFQTHLHGFTSVFAMFYEMPE